MAGILHSFALYKDPISDSFPFLLPAGATNGDGVEPLLGRGLTKSSSLVGNERGLAGLIISALVECELLAFLKSGRRKGIRNYRNGYVTRTLKTGIGDVNVQICRDRLGLFDPQLVGRYSRQLDADPADVLSLAVADGYSEEERRLMLESLYAPGDLSASMRRAVIDEAMTQFKAWNDSTSPEFIRTAVGWIKTIHHKNGIDKMVVGVTGLDERRNLVGIRAIAGSSGELHALIDKLVAETASIQGVVMPLHIVVPDGCAFFADAIHHYWPGCTVFEDHA